MKFYIVLLFSCILSFASAAFDAEAPSPDASTALPSDAVVIEVVPDDLPPHQQPNEEPLSDAFQRTDSMIAVYDTGNDSDVESAAVGTRRHLARLQHRSHHRRREPSYVAPSSAEPTAQPFDVAAYYDREAYLTGHVRKLIVDEATFNARATIYNKLGTAAMWVAGISGFATTVVSTLGAASIIPPEAASVSTACMGAFTTFCIWTSAQFKKSGSQYHQASTAIQVKLGVPSKLITPQVDIRIDPLRNTGMVDMVQPAASSAALRRSQ
jgi:hypothetical protein